MTRKLLFSLAALLIVSMPSHAQEQSGESADPDVTTSRYRDWALSCRTNTETNTQQCTMFQRLVVEETKQVALNVAIGYLRNDEGRPVPVAIITFPLGIWLPGGATMRVDSGEPIRFAIERCFRRGCQTGITLTDDILAQFRAGSQATITIQQARDQNIDLNVSLSGFSAGFKALTDASNG